MRGEVGEVRKAKAGNTFALLRVAAGGDVSKVADAKGIIDAAIKNYGRIHILVNNSGVYRRTASCHRRHF
jgi:NAD(P)-dependent dehydrogenase (short-subunit alcohol dehydrogenase family)